jgi:catechol-2,3-dioxygenase
MTQGPRLTGAVVYVRDLDRSVSFYKELLQLDIFDSSATAALLSCDDGTYLILRATGPEAAKPLGAIGIQYLVWTMRSEAELDRAEQFLHARSAFRQVQTGDGIKTVEGHDPDDMAVLLIWAADAQTALRHLPTRIYAW